MKVEKRIKRANEASKRRFQRLLERITATNDTGLSDATLLAILNAKHGPWSDAMTGEELLASLGIAMQ